MHYVGAIFDINNIEKRLLEAKLEYQQAVQGLEANKELNKSDLKT